MIAVMAEVSNGECEFDDVVAIFTTQEKADNFLKAMQDFFEHDQKCNFYVQDYIPPPTDPESINEVIWKGIDV